jgi:hypothetical protein
MLWYPVASAQAYHPGTFGDQQHLWNAVLSDSELHYQGEFYLDGIPQDLDYLRFDSPYVQAPRKPGMISITRDDKSLHLDFYGLKREVGDAD